MTIPRSEPRPVLRPGWQVVRRDDGHLQVGLDDPHRVVLPDIAEVRRMLTLLADQAAPWAPPAALSARHALERLRAAGLVVPRPGPGLLAVQLAASHGLDAADRLARRRAAAVGLDGPSTLTEPAAALLRAAGVDPCRPERAGLVVVLASGQVRRDRLDGLLSAGTPHLLVTGGAVAWELGPLVVPGASACVRCVDAARGEHDPRRAMVLEQLAGVASPPRDPALQAAALALATREVVSHVDGDRPATWSATITLGPDGPQRQSWRRHPHCGCAWDALAH